MLATHEKQHKDRSQQARIGSNAPISLCPQMNPAPLLQRSNGNSYLQTMAASDSTLLQNVPSNDVPRIQRVCACGGTCGCGHKEDEPEKIQTKLTISQPGDIYEQEAEQVAERVMHMPETWTGGITGRRDSELEIRRLATNNTPNSASGIGLGLSGGQPLSPSTRAFMQPRFGMDFGDVRLHTDEASYRTAAQLQARAFTYGHHIWFGTGETEENRTLMAHELTHVVQQTNPSTPRGIFRLSKTMCATDCTNPDVDGTGPATSWTLTLAVDREEEGLLRLVSGNVGHTWVKLRDDKGTIHSYGFWPQTGFDPAHPLKPVPGCVHHPDVAHEPPAATNYIDISYSLTNTNYMKGLAHAADACRASPDYDLTTYNCTSFAIDVAKAAGITPPSSTTLAIDNPNALYEGIEDETKKRGRKGGGSETKKTP